ncbi:hypothetical protein BHM03_00019009 [Ensete ventricosum]|nr:hypothetical protein BHM03_00019009 [Ensete ventricosum]
MVDHGSNDVVASSSKSSLEVGQGLDDVVGSLPRVLERFAGKFIRRSPTGCRELTGKMLGVRREFTERDRKFVGGLPEGCWEFTERPIND